MANLNGNEKTTLNQSFQIFINMLSAENKSELTLIAYKEDLECFKAFLMKKYTGIRYIQEVTLNEIVDYLTYLRAE